MTDPKALTGQKLVSDEVLGRSVCSSDAVMLVGSMKCLVVAVEVDCGGVLCLSHPGDVGRPLFWGSWQR